MSDTPSKRDLYSKDLIGPIVEPSPRRVRVKFGGEIIADSKAVYLLRQYGPGKLPTYYFPESDVRVNLLTAGKRTAEIAFWNLQAGRRRAADAAWTYLEPPEDRTALKGYFSFAWDQMDAWYEEEEEIFVHARDPYKRVDVLRSNRHVRVEIDGRIVADSRRPYLLFETGLPTRYYLPPTDVRMDLLVPSKLQTRCPYKGLASYWTFQEESRRLENVVWSYPKPIPENPKIKDLMCFFNEWVDISVDGELQPRPKTPWSK